MKDRMDKIEKYLEENNERSRGLKQHQRPDWCGELRPSSSINSLTNDENTFNEFLSELKAKLSVPKYIIILPGNLSSYVRTVQELTEHE